MSAEACVVIKLAAARLYNCALIGAIDGVNATYATPTYFTPGNECVLKNGLRLRVTVDYTRAESGGMDTGFDRVVMLAAPLPGDWLVIDFDPAT